MVAFLMISLGISASAQIEVRYVISNENYFENQQLIAVVGNDTFTLIDSTERVCAQKVGEKDFNYDGYSDLLLEIVNGCGGNCCGNSYQYISYNGKSFVQSKVLGYDWNGIDLFQKDGNWYLVIETVNAGCENTDLCGDKTETYMIEGYSLKLVESKQEQKIPAVKEITSNEFIGQNASTLSLSCDLNSDGLTDSIVCSYWERWGAFSDWKIIFANGDVYYGKSTPKRIGILDAKTNGYFNLVVGCDEIIKWNGQEYEELPDE
ncbi:hypothetical protein GC194_02355 [bacterium]|nr:hypothetical protein [bacterium]